MPVYAVIGGHWGDEGKGKVIDVLADRASIVARFAGGNNAGHTVVVPEGTFSFHMLPSGMCRKDTVNLIGNGVVVDPDILLEEISLTESSGLPGKAIVSDRAHLVMPYHLLLDRLEEERRKGGAIGTTGRGIGPAYVDKAARRGIRVGELLYIEELLPRLREIVEFNNSLITAAYGSPPIDFYETEDKVRRWSTNLAKVIGSAEQILSDALERGDNVIAEGAQGTLLDIDHGTYPFVTSSNSTVGGAVTGLGVGPRAFAGVAGVFKAYCTRVGAGPFPTEMKGEYADSMREEAGEFGVTTGRPRRIGWFDAVAGRYSATVNGLDCMILTRLDTLDGRGPVRLCHAYELKGEKLSTFPLDSALLGECKPIYEEVPGWSSSTKGALHWKDLPYEAQHYVRRLEELLEIPTVMISTGPSREETIMLGEFVT